MLIYFLRFTSGISEKRGNSAFTHRRTKAAGRRRRVECQKRTNGVGTGSAMDQSRFRKQKGTHSRSDEEHQTGSLGHAVFFGKRQGSPVRRGQRRLQTDHNRDPEISVRSGNDHAERRRGADAGDRAAQSPARDTVRHWWLERRFPDELHRDVRHAGGSMDSGSTSEHFRIKRELLSRVVF